MCLSHLSFLRSLSLQSAPGLSEQSALPASLAQLTCFSLYSTHCIPDLPNLLQLQEYADFSTPSLLCRVSRMPRLQKLVLELGHHTAGVSPASQCHQKQPPHTKVLSRPSAGAWRT